MLLGFSEQEYRHTCVFFILVLELFSCMVCVCVCLCVCVCVCVSVWVAHRTHLRRCMTPRKSMVKLMMQAIPITMAINTPTAEQKVHGVVRLWRFTEISEYRKFNLKLKLTHLWARP